MSPNRSFPRIFTLATLLTLCTLGCLQPQKRTPAPPPAAAALRPDQASAFDRHCGPWGPPEKRLDFGPTCYINHDGYVMEYSDKRKIALWVCHYVPAAQLTKAFSGSYHRPAWREEECLPTDLRAKDSDYPPGGKPYNRGHMAPNGDFGTREARDDTFILSNAVPQQWQNNQEIWETFEGLVRKWIKSRGQAYIITGTLRYDPNLGILDLNLNAPLVPDVMGASQIAVPTHLFKIILAPKAKGSNQWESLAIVLENRAYDKGPDQTFNDDYERNLESLDWIEERSGLNFLSNLPEGSPEEKSLESEAAKPAHLWPN